MTKKTLLFILLLTTCLSIISAQESLNVSLYAQYNRGEQRYSGSWYYTAEDGTEYALLGAHDGTAIYRIMEAGQLEEVAYIPGPQTNWREITVVEDHAYVVTDVSGIDNGMQVIRLDQLPEQATLLTNYTLTFTKGHIIQKDIFSETPYVYIAGTTTTQGVHIMDVSDPENPVEAGLYHPGYYIHDCHIRGDTMFASAFYEGTIDFVDISDKSNPILIARMDIPDGKVHSASLTTDGKFLFVAPEQDGLPARLFNIEDFSDPVEVASYTANPISLVHNPYILGDFAFITHNTEGLRVVDITDPTTPVEVGFYDTWPGESGGFNGLWSGCPYLPSGKIIGGNREDGLYVWEFNQTKAGRLYGTVVDSITNLPISNAEIRLLENDHVVYSSALGEFRTGAVPGTYTLKVTAQGYPEKEITIDFDEESSAEVTLKLSNEITATGLAEAGEEFNIFPNPFCQKTMIETCLDTKIKTIEIMDGAGKTIEIFNPGPMPYELNMEAWPMGTYFLKAMDKNGKSVGVRSLIKN